MSRTTKLPTLARIALTFMKQHHHLQEDVADSSFFFFFLSVLLLTTNRNKSRLRSKEGQGVRKMISLSIFGNPDFERTTFGRKENDRGRSSSLELRTCSLHRLCRSRKQIKSFLLNIYATFQKYKVDIGQLGFSIQCTLHGRDQQTR